MTVKVVYYSEFTMVKSILLSIVTSLQYTTSNNGVLL